MRILETKRTFLRRLESSDLDKLYALYRDPDVRRYFPEGILTLEETEEELEWFLQGHPTYSELGLWATVLKETDTFIGRCGLLPQTIEGQSEVEVAYLIDKAYWGQGLATEVAEALVEYAFKPLGLTRLICMVEPANLASKRVAEKMGMSLEKEMTDNKGPFLLYSLSRS